MMGWFLFALALFFFTTGALFGIWYRRDIDRLDIAAKIEAEHAAREAEVRRAGFHIIEPTR